MSLTLQIETEPVHISEVDPTRTRRKSLSEQLWGNVPAKVDSNRRPSVIQATAAASDVLLESGDEPPRRERRLSLQGGAALIFRFDSRFHARVPVSFGPQAGREWEVVLPMQPPRLDLSGTMVAVTPSSTCLRAPPPRGPLPPSIAAVSCPVQQGAGWLPHLVPRQPRHPLGLRPRRRA